MKSNFVIYTDQLTSLG